MSQTNAPIDMVLHCPHCREQHIDAPKACDMGVGCDETGVCYAEAHGEPDRCTSWTNPPHRSHLCAHCGTIWRPADVPTNGVAAIKTKGKDDSPVAPECCVCGTNKGLSRDGCYGYRCSSDECMVL